MTREEAELEILKEFRAYGDYNPKHLSDFLKMVKVATDQYIARREAEAKVKQLESIILVRMKEAFMAGVGMAEMGIDYENGGTIEGAFDSYMHQQEKI